MKRILSILLIVALLISLPLPTYASTISEQKDKLHNVKDKLQETNQKLNNNRKTQKTLEQQLEQVEQELQEKEKELSKIEQELTEKQTLLSKVTNELNLAEEELEKAKDDLEHARQELEKAIQDTKDHEDLMADRLRAMYMNKNTSYLELLFESKSLNDFFAKVDMIKKMVTYDNQVYEELQSCRDQIEDKKDDCEEKASNIEQKRNDIRLKKIELEDQTQKINGVKVRVSRQKESIKVSQEEKNRLKKELEKEEARLARELDELERLSKEIEKKIKELTANSKLVYLGGVMAWPVPYTTRVTSEYKLRLHPIHKVYKWHTGIDIAAQGIAGQPAVAAADGVVIVAEHQDRSGYGKYVIIDHGSGIATLYAHASSVLVTAGQKVTKGTPVIRIGKSGTSTGYHLHFEVRKNGQHTNPWPYLKGN